jgi:hypothetical protein
MPLTPKRSLTACARSSPRPRPSASICPHLLEHVTASRCQLDVTPWRRRAGRRGRRRLRCWCGSLRLRCGSFHLSWGRQRLFCSRRRCRDRRHDWLCGRCRDLWRRIGRELPHGGWPDQCGEHRAVFARYRARHRQLCRSEHARGGAYQGGDHCILGMYSPPSHHAPNLRVCAKAKWRFTVTTSYDSHHCRRQAPPLLPLGVDSMRWRAGDTEETGPCRAHPHHQLRRRRSG